MIYLNKPNFKDSSTIYPLLVFRTITSNKQNKEAK